MSTFDVMIHWTDYVTAAAGKERWKWFLFFRPLLDTSTTPVTITGILWIRMLALDPIVGISTGELPLPSDD